MKTLGVIRDTFVRGEHVEAGTSLDVGSDITETEASSLLASGKAIPIDQAQKAAARNRAKDGSGSSTK